MLTEAYRMLRVLISRMLKINFKNLAYFNNQKKTCKHIGLGIFIWIGGKQ